MIRFVGSFVVSLQIFLDWLLTTSLANSSWSSKVHCMTIQSGKQIGNTLYSSVLSVDNMKIT